MTHALLLVETTNLLSPVGVIPRQPSQARLRRYKLQDAARDILPDNRVAWCLRNRQPNAPSVDVLRSLRHGATYYRNLLVCSQVWVCPVCAAKITERRREELQHGVATFTGHGGTVALVSFTFPHQREDILQDMLNRLRKARAWLRGGKAAAALRVSVGLTGTIRVLEVTYGDVHGWHPHIHELWFMVHPPAPSLIQERLYERWHHAAVKAGFAAPTREHGVDVRRGDHAARYTSKWGLDAELTKSHLKHGRSDRYSPFDFLRFYADGHDQARYAALFRDFAAAFAGRQQLRWSKGLKGTLCLGEASDAQLNTENRELAELLGRIAHKDWVLVRQAGLRGVLLEIARAGWPPVEELLVRLRRAAAARELLLPHVRSPPL